MSYQKQNFANGEVLSASQLNHIEQGIVDVESAANATKTVVDKIIDPTLSLSGKAADAKATGDAIGELNESIISVSNGLIHIKLLRDKYVDLNGEIKSFSGWTETARQRCPADSCCWGMRATGATTGCASSSGASGRG